MNDQPKLTGVLQKILIAILFAKKLFTRGTLFGSRYS